MITPALVFWWRLFSALALEVCCLAILGFAAQRLARSAFWRRAAWQITVVCLLAAAVSEWTGVGQALGKHLAPRQQAVETEPAPHVDPATRGEPIEMQIVALPPQMRAVWWPGLIWLAGTLLLLGRTALAQGLLFTLRFVRARITDGPLRESVARLSPRLGLRQKVCLRRMSALVSPMAFGILQPCIGLPAQFETQFSRAEQDAVLAHELAHLAARDPLWFLLADLAVAALWWHPAAWWARQRLHAISEHAADEATAIVSEGPQALARCLVALGKQMADMGAWGWVGINGGGIRSNLGRRVEGLLRLSGDAPPPSFGRGARAAKIAMLLAAAPLTVLAFGSIQTTQGQSEETWRYQLAEAWHQSPAGVLLMARRDDTSPPNTTNREQKAAQLGSVPSPEVSEIPAMEQHKIDIATRVNLGKFLYELGKYDEAEAILKQVIIDDPSNRSAQYYLDLITKARLRNPKPTRDTNLIYSFRGRPRILSKLNNIILDEVSYDLPLKDVLKRLRTESEKRDPDGVGINFMINEKVDVPAATNGAIPVPATLPQDIGSEVTIHISPPLKNCRLADVLDAITAAADKPIRYTIKDYAVVFSPKPSEATTLYIKTFRVDPKTFVQGLQNLSAVTLNPSARTAGAGSSGTNSTLAAHEMVRSYFTAAGVDLFPPKTVFFNDRLGELLVRGSLSDLEIIQRAVESLNQNPTK